MIVLSPSTSCRRKTTYGKDRHNAKNTRKMMYSCSKITSLKTQVTLALYNIGKTHMLTGLTYTVHTACGRNGSRLQKPHLRNLRMKQRSL